MATEAAWLNGNNLEKEETRKKKEKRKISLDTHRPSHARVEMLVYSDANVKIKRCRPWRAVKSSASGQGISFNYDCGLPLLVRTTQICG